MRGQRKDGASRRSGVCAILEVCRWTRGVFGNPRIRRACEYRRSIVASAPARATRYTLARRALKTRCVLPRLKKKHDGRPARVVEVERKTKKRGTPRGKMSHTRAGSGPPGAKRVQTSYTPFSCFLLQHFSSLYPFSPYHGFSLQASRRPLRCCQERHRPPRRRATNRQGGTPIDSSVGAATRSMSSFLSCASPPPTAHCCRRTINHLITAMINNHKMRGRGETITERARARARLQTSRRM